MPYQTLMNGLLEELPNHYQVLDLPWAIGNDSELSAQYIKAAYRRALLLYHPDKTQAQSDLTHEKGRRSKVSREFTYTIDQISEAYAVLSVPELRFEYDRALKLHSCHLKGVKQGDNQAFRSGLETMDLDDLVYDEEKEVWLKSCRCGDEQGFQILGADLEEASDLGELYVGCRGCSLWLRVLFEVAGESGEDHVEGCR